MFSRIILKLIDQAIVPAITLLAARIISVVLISRQLGVPFEITSMGFSFARMVDYVKVNSYSVFVILMIITLGVVYVLLKSLVFHDSHIHPGTAAKMYSLNMNFLIQSSYDIYTQGAVWLSYMYLTMIAAGIMSLLGLIYAWVFYLAFIITAISTVGFVMDVENELTAPSAMDKDKSLLESEE